MLIHEKNGPIQGQGALCRYHHEYHRPSKGTRATCIRDAICSCHDRGKVWEQCQASSVVCIS